MAYMTCQGAICDGVRHLDRPGIHRGPDVDDAKATAALLGLSVWAMVKTPCKGIL